MNQKTSILKIIIVSIFFVFATSIYAATLVGSIDPSVDNKAKVCKDVPCVDPGIIDFNTSGGSPLVIDKEKGISGKAWGNEFGWITFNPPYGGVFFADTNTGLLKGTAWSETSGAINFSVTGQKVIIDPNTGEWNGWAWASGPYGGWIKFDCQAASCVHTIWQGQSSSSYPQGQGPASSTKNKGSSLVSIILNNFSDSFANLYSGTKETIKEDGKLIGHTLGVFALSSADLFGKTGQITVDVYNYLSSYLMSLKNSVLEGVNNLFR